MGVDKLNELNLYLAELIYFYKNEISVAIIATFLVLYGANVNSFVKRKIAHWFVGARVGMFIFLCTFGYGLITVSLHPIVSDIIINIKKEYSFFTIVLLFILLGVLAERKNFV